MTNLPPLGRRRFLQASASTLAGLTVGELLASTPAFAHGPTPGIGYFACFGVSEELLRRTVAAALATGGDDADVYFQQRSAHGLTLIDGKVSRASVDAALGAGVRVVTGEATGYAFTEELTPAALATAARTAAAIARAGTRHAPVRMSVARPMPTRYPELVDWGSVTAVQKAAVLRTVQEQTLASDPRIKDAIVTLWDYQNVMLVATADGRVVEDRQPLTQLFLAPVAEANGQRVQNMVNAAGRAGFEFCTPARIAELVRRGVADTLALFDAVEAPAGEMPVVLAPGSAGILLHEAIGHGLEGDFNRKGISAYAGAVGTCVAAPFVNVIDDGTRPGGPGSLNVDDEGTPAGRTTLVENGRLVSYLHDRLSARHYGVAPTGSGRRQGYEYAPLPRMRCTYMPSGPHKHDEIIASVKRGLYCDHFGNGLVSLGAGDFSFFVANGYLIEDGKLTRPVKDINLTGNGPAVLRTLDMAADDLAIDDTAWMCGKYDQRVPVSFGVPTVRIPTLTVGGRGRSA